MQSEGREASGDPLSIFSLAHLVQFHRIETNGWNDYFPMYEAYDDMNALLWPH